MPSAGVACAEGRQEGGREAPPTQILQPLGRPPTQVLGLLGGRCSQPGGAGEGHQQLRVSGPPRPLLGQKRAERSATAVGPAALTWLLQITRPFPTDPPVQGTPLPPSLCGPLTRCGGCWSECSSWIWISGQGGSVGFLGSDWGEREGPGWGEAQSCLITSQSPLAPFREQGGRTPGHQGERPSRAGQAQPPQTRLVGRCKKGRDGFGTWRAPSAGGAGAVVQPRAVDEGVAFV